MIIEYNSGASDRKYLKNTIEADMSVLYYYLYNKSNFDFDISSISISSFHTLTDKYGHKNNQEIYKTILTNKEAEKINWNASEDILKSSIIQSVWTTQKLHSYLR